MSSDHPPRDESLKLRTKGLATHGELRGAERPAVMGGTTRGSTAFTLFDDHVVIDERELVRGDVSSVSASSAGPALSVVFRDGQSLRVDAHDHDLDDVEWLAARMNRILRVDERTRIIEQLDTLSLTLMTEDPKAAQQTARMLHFMGALFVLIFVGVLANEAPQLARPMWALGGVTSLLLGFDAVVAGYLARLLSQPVPAEVTITPQGFGIRGETTPWHRVEQVRITPQSRLLQLRGDDWFRDLRAPPDLLIDDLQRAHDAAAAFVDAFHSDEALAFEQRLREEKSALHTGSRKAEQPEKPS